MEDLLQVGVFSSTHGVRGEFKVFPTTDDVKRFSDLDTVIMDTGKRSFEAEIEHVKYFKQFAILKIKGYDSLNDIEPLKGSTLWVRRDQAVELAQDEYFIADLIGMEVYLEDGSRLGILKDVIETGANDVYEVIDDKKKSWYLPAIGECILSVDVEAARMVVHLMPGLEEL
ncbi:MAG: 16S rRNA processing protein RimM [Lachnospiraceae bacterium]|jgi:16S rRNA processing protein RimM|nr:16S rRNA processing protein RimM [Lachnospiraceae bacterium]